MPPKPEKLNKVKSFRKMLLAEDRFYGRLLGSSFVGVLTLAVIAAILVFLSVREHRAEGQGMRALQAMGEASDAEAGLANIEASYHGFLLTGIQSYIDPFEKKQVLTKTGLERLAGMLNDHGQRQRVAQASMAFQKWLQEVAMPAIEKRRGGAATAGSLENDKSLEEIRKALQTIEGEKQSEAEALPDRKAATRALHVRIYSAKLAASISGMENAEWEYLLTGSRTALDGYRSALNDFNAYHGHLSVLLSDVPDQIQPLTQIRAAMDRWQREAAAPEFAAKTENKDAASLVARNNGRQIIEDAGVQVDALLKSQDANFQYARTKETVFRVGRTAGLALLCIAAMAMLALSGWSSFKAYSRQLKKLEVAEAETCSIIETSLDGIVTINDQGTIESVNPAAEKMFGFSSRDLIGNSVQKIIPQRLFMQDMARLGAGTLTTTANRQDGNTFPIEISISKMSVGRKKSYVALIRDVTERKRSEDTLRHIGLGVSFTTGEEFIRALVKQLSKALQSDFAFIVETTKKDEDDACTLVIAEHGNIRSRGNYRLTNTVCEEVLRKGFRAFSNDVAEQFPKDPILRELNARSFVGMPLNDHKGKAVGVMGVIDTKPMENVQVAESTLQIFAARAAAEVERKRFEDDLNAEKERLAITLRSIGDGFIATDVNGIVVMMNNVAERLTGWHQDEAMGRPLVDIFYLLNERTRKPSQSVVQRIIETGSVVGANHALVVSREGVERLVENSAAQIRDRGNRRLGTVLVFRDITDRERLEEERRKAEKLESLGVAAGGIAHDFNNLLTAIIGNLSLCLITLPPGDEMHERITTAKKASLRAQDLAQQLLTFAKGGAPIKKTASVGQLIRETVTFSLRGSNVRSEFETPEELWPVEIDAGQISQVINNLSINAEQAMPAGGTLRVHCENFEMAEEIIALAPLRAGRYVKISIEDEGIGIPEEYLKKIFDPYFTTKPKGSGLGLATSYSIIKNHDGLITVGSRVNVGSTFTIYLPATEKEPMTERLRPASLEPVIGRGRILVLDDEEAICELVKAALTPLGYDVTEARDALTAIQLYRDAMDEGQKFDAVISDLTIPGGMGGAEAVKKLVELDPDVKAIVSSGYATDPVMSRYRDYGFCACIAKPYEISDLGNVVNDVLNSQNNGGDSMVYHDFEQSQLQ